MDAGAVKESLESESEAESLSSTPRDGLESSSIQVNREIESDASSPIEDRSLPAMLLAGKRIFAALSPLFPMSTAMISRADIKGLN